MRFMFSLSREMAATASSKIFGSSLPQRRKRLAYPAITDSGVLSSCDASEVTREYFVRLIITSAVLVAVFIVLGAGSAAKDWRTPQ